MKPMAVPPSGFPRVDGETQRGRDDTRRKILQDELDTEQKLLEAAKQNLNEAESNPEVFTGQDGKTYRNVAKYDEKVKPLQDQVDLHTKNIEALKTELNKLPK
jgi:predicted RNase H-like nuclease (RuvC/YqgF family)